MLRIYDFNSARYRRASLDVKTTIQCQGRRATYTDKMKAGLPATWAPKLTCEQNRTLRFYKQWRLEVLGRTDQQWFDAIDAAIEERHLRAYVYQLLWWELCEQVDLDDEAWKVNFKDFDYAQALDTDWPLMAYALHCCGLHPFVADRIAAPCSDRIKWANSRKLEYQCPVCDEVSSDYDAVPRQCKLCFQRDTAMIRIA